MSITYNPDNWVTSLMRSLKAYVEANVEANLDPDAPDLYDIRFEWPDTSKMTKETPLTKTLIHFDIDDEDNPVIGMGDSVIDAVYNDIAGTVVEREGACHVINFDVGVWASVETGGPTSRMEAREVLTRCLQGPSARAACRDATDGVEILSFSGGANIIDTVNDLTIWRIQGMELRVRVYSRKALVPIVFIDEITQDQVVVVENEIQYIVQDPDLIIP